MSDELIEVYDKQEGFLFSATNEQEVEQLCRNAIREGFHPCTRKEFEDANK